MNQIMIIAGKETEKENLVGLLDCYSDSQILYASNSKQAKEIIASASPTLIIINAPLPSESAQDLAIFMTQRTDAAVVVLLPDSYRNIKEYSGEDYGILTLYKPFKRSEFDRTVKFAMAFENRIAKIQEKNKKLQKQLTEVRTVHRAKCLLIQHLQMSESQAHRYIEKHAMDCRKSKLEVANSILQSYHEI